MDAGGRHLNAHVLPEWRRRATAQSRWSRGDGTAALAPSSQNTCDHNGLLAGSDLSDLSVGVAESIVAPNGGFLA